MFGEVFFSGSGELDDLDVLLSDISFFGVDVVILIFLDDFDFGLDDYDFQIFFFKFLVIN